MEITVYCSKSKSCQNFRIGHTIHLQWRKENERDVRRRHTRGEGGRGGEERRRRRSRIAKLADKTQKRVAPPPAQFQSLGHCHGMEYRVPLCGLDIGTEIFIESMARTTIVALNFQCFSDLEVIGDTFFVFATHCSKHFGAIPVNNLVAVFFVLVNARMLPIAFFRCFLMLLTSVCDGPYGLSDIDCFFITLAVQPVNTLFLNRRRERFVFPA